VRDRAGLPAEGAARRPRAFRTADTELRQRRVATLEIFRAGDIFWTWTDNRSLARGHVRVIYTGGPFEFGGGGGACAEF